MNVKPMITVLRVDTHYNHYSSYQLMAHHLWGWTQLSTNKWNSTSGSDIYTIIEDSND